MFEVIATLKTDPLTQKDWLTMKKWVQALAVESAREAGFSHFKTNVCLINKYIPGTRLGMHVDNDKGETQSPILAFGLGVPAIFRWGGLTAKDPTIDILLNHGDIVG